MNPNRYIPDIWSFDYIVAFLYILIIYLFAFAYSKNKLKVDSSYKYYMWALSAKIFGGLGFLVLTVYYWGGGDTYSYWNTANDFTSLFFQDPIKGLRIIFTPASEMNWYEYEFAYNRHQFLRSTDTFTTVKITAILNILSFRSYVVCTVLYSTFSFLGVWSMYGAFSRIYPHLKKQLLLAFFFIPSVVLWGSGILKDTITISAMGYLVSSFINLIIFKERKTKSLIIIVLATLTIAFLKPYILYVLYPALFIWVQSNIKALIKSNLLRRLLAPFVAVVLITLTVFMSRKLSQSAGRYQLDRIENTLEGFQSWHTTVSETQHQSGYTLGTVDFSLTGIIKSVPQAVVVTFYRPYLWEVYNASTLLAAMEGLILFLISLWLLLKYRIKLFRLIYRNKDVLFLFIFSIVFAVVVGISSYNFGALSRYKIPAQMFFVVALVLLIDKTEDRKYLIQ